MASEQDKFELNAAELIIAHLGVYTAMPMQMIKEKPLRSIPIGRVLKAHFDAKNATQSRLDAHKLYNARKDKRATMRAEAREALEQLTNI